MVAFSSAGTTKQITAAVTSSRVALPVFPGNRSVRVFNATGGTVFIEFGTSAVVADVVGSMPIGAGVIEVFGVGSGDSHVAGITASGGGTVYFTEGDGE